MRPDLAPRIGSLCALVLLGGCGSAPPQSPPTGVDELQIPTPSPAADDFVDAIDNPWLPLSPGSRWVYRTSSSPVQTEVVTVGRERPRVAGVTTTEVGTVLKRGGRVLERTRAWFAQDRAGNVWAFGSASSGAPGAPGAPATWKAGVDGARAGVAMLAEPRIGDGYAIGYRPGVVEDVAKVASLGVHLTVPAGDFSEVLETEYYTPLDTTADEDRYYARGTGLIAHDDLELVSYSPDN